MYVCVYIRVYVYRKCVCLYICMYVCMYVCMYEEASSRSPVGVVAADDGGGLRNPSWLGQQYEGLVGYVVYSFTHVYVSVYVCMYVCMYVSV